MSELGRADAARPRRPRSVVVLVVMVVLESLLLVAIGALVLVATRTSSDDMTGLAIDESQLLVVGGVVAAVGLAQLALVFLLGRGSEIARSWFGAFAVLKVATGVYSTVALREFEPAAIAPLVLAVLVLWLLYGSDQTQEFFQP